jgi:CRISPR/Cas system-associated endoribonuclease Cas2
MEKHSLTFFPCFLIWILEDKIMSKASILLFISCSLFLIQASNAHAEKQEAMVGISQAYYSMFDSDNPYATKDMLDHIRRERFDLILPRVMRENKIDMWIHVIRPWSWSGNEFRRLEGTGQNYKSLDSTDPMRYEFGSNSGVIIFTDGGGDRIERVVFEGEVEDAGAYDIVYGPSKFVNQENYEISDYMAENKGKGRKSELDYRFIGLGEFVAERDPKRIGVNYSEKLSLAEGSETYTLALTDGISYADHLQLTKTLGDKYAERMVSAEYLILDYLTRRVMSEIVLFGGSGVSQKERAFDEIEPGVTTLSDVNGDWFCTRDSGHDESAFRDYPLHRGDMFQRGTTPYYILREEEAEPPPAIREVWQDVLTVREILRNNLKVGPTAGEMLELLIREIEKAGFVYINRDTFDMNLDPEKTQVHFDMHAMGKGLLAPRISPMGPRWHWDTKIPLFHTFAVEYMVHKPVPEWGKGKHIYICIHDSAVVTGRGMEYAYPPVNKVRIIKIGEQNHE